MHRMLAAASAGSLLALAVVAPASATVVVDEPIVHSAADPSLAIAPIGTHATGTFDESAAEIVAHYAAADRTLVVNAQQGVIDVIDASDPANPERETQIEAAGTPVADGAAIPSGSVANSVAVRTDGLAVVAVEAPEKTDPGWLMFVDVTGDEPVSLGAITVGALPDSVVLSPDGHHAVVANEGEPAEDYSVDPEGSVGVVALPDSVAAATQADYRTADFHAFEGGAVSEEVRIYGGREDAGTGTPERPVSENLEPEYSAVIGGRAYTTLQENNAVAITDLATATVEDIVPLETTDLRDVAFDVSDRDDAIDPANWPVTAFRAPDTIKAVEIAGEPHLVTANEGDLRDWDAFSEESRVKDFGSDGVPPLCDTVASDTGMTLEELTADENLGRLTATTADGLSDEEDCYDEIHVSGSRSFSVLDADGAEVFDSGSLFEEITAEAHPDFFNSNHSETNFDGRSDDKGPEPEAIEVGAVGDRAYAFVGFERVSGFAAVDISDPHSPDFVTYVNNRDFSVSGEDEPERFEEAGDLGPESIEFVPGADAPAAAAGSGTDAMLIVGNEVSGTTTYYTVEDLLADGPTEEPSGEPTDQPTDQPTAEPTEQPSGEPSEQPSEQPSGEPSEQPSDEPSTDPTDAPDEGEDGEDDQRDEARDDDEGSLPRTGASVAAALGAAALLVGIGIAATVMARRRS
ncbi:MAG: choice-of-anchor I family protein [Brevibacterium yomogidense]|uniref:choice-of-anchor I family protein n=1 Tax=Brevibacterium sp. Mu109 TaxID=1255669 RepID=UPI000C35DDF9|nr:choice-of-anchor I family protein [Brevibacterium sp. Mu109]SMX68281.1 PT repeat-containing protein [Brevibacterium sp. Mu109]